MAPTPEFDLAILAQDSGYTVTLRAASGVDLPPEPLQLAMQLPALPAYREIARFVAAAREVRLGPDAELRDAKRVGGALFNALFPREVLARFRAARDALPDNGRLLVRLRLPPTLVGIPWELLYDAPNDQFIALADDLALVRCPEMANPLRPLQLTGALQVLVVLASPRGVRPIDLDRELTRVQAALRGPIAQERVALEVIRGTGTLEQLRRRLAKPVHVLHILCHGDLDEQRGEGVLLFEDSSGDKELISAAQLRMLIEKQRGQTRLVLLNSCLGAVSGGNDPFGSVGAALMRGGVPAVVAMQFEIPAESAQELARIFYTDLADGRPIDMALTEARRHLFGYDSLRLDWAIPALFLRGNDGALFSLANAPTLPRDEPIPASGLVNPTAQYRQAMAAFFADEWQQAEQLLSVLVQANPGFRDAQSRLTEARLQIELAEQYTLLLDLRAANNWRAVQGGLADIERQKPGYPDPQALMVWAAAAQRREEQYDAALEAVGQQQWTAAHTTLKALLAEQPDAAAIKLLARVESELRKIAEQERQRKIAEAAAQKQAEEERQRKIADAAAQKRAEEEQQRKAAEAAAQKRAEEERQRKAAAAAQKQAEKEQQRKAAAAAVPQPTSRSSTPNQPTNPTRSRLLIGLGLAALMLAVVASIVFSRRTPSPTALPTSVPAIENPTANATPVWTALPTSVPALENPTATDLSLLQVPGGAALTFVEVPGGAFLMGASDHDTNAQSDEKPQHTVTLPTYWIGKTEVTNAQYRPFVTGDGYSNPAYWTSAGWAWREKNNVVAPAYWHDSTLNGDDLPVGGMSWYEAMAYCRWLSSKTGEDIQLPTEAEWEKAARGTDGRIYPWGDTWNQTYAQSTSGGSVPIGSYPAGASPYGALDMAGNVWEWTRSEYRSYPYNPIDGREDATNPDGKRFTLRGGGWSIESIDLRASGRYYYFTPDFHDRNVGFRLARHRK